MLSSNWLKKGIPMLLLVGLGIFYYQRYKIPPELDVTKISMTDLNENPVSLEDFKGKTVVFTVWATWCPPCVKEMPLMQEMAATLAPKDVAFVLVSDETIFKINQFKEKRKLSIPLYHLTDNMNTIGVYSIPCTFILNKKGKVVHKHLGEFNSKEELMTAIELGK
jgi:thiol-disulfide isomerase/thioredoxin